MVDFYLSSPSFIFKFVDVMQTELGLSHASCLGYLGAVSYLNDFRTIYARSSKAVLRNVMCT